MWSPPSALPVTKPDKRIVPAAQCTSSVVGNVHFVSVHSVPEIDVEVSLMPAELGAEPGGQIAAHAGGTAVAAAGVSCPGAHCTVR